MNHPISYKWSFYPSGENGARFVQADLGDGLIVRLQSLFQHDLRNLQKQGKKKFRTWCPKPEKMQEKKPPL